MIGYRMKNWPASMGLEMAAQTQKYNVDHSAEDRHKCKNVH